MHGSHGPKCSLKRCGFLEYCRHQSCVSGFKSWRGWQVNVTLFFYTTQKQVLQIVPVLTESYEICILGFRPRLLHMCWPMYDGVQFSHIFLGGVGGGGNKGVFPDSWQLAWKVTFLPVAGCQLHYDALERTVWLKTALSTLPVSMWLLHIFLRCDLVFSRWFFKF